MGFSPPVIPKAFFAYVLGSKSFGRVNLAPAGSMLRNRESANVATLSLAVFHANTYQLP